MPKILRVDLDRVWEDIINVRETAGNYEDTSEGYENILERIISNEYAPNDEEGK